MWIGDVVSDRFTIERPVGAGGMGSVFLGRMHAHFGDFRQAVAGEPTLQEIADPLVRGLRRAAIAEGHLRLGNLDAASFEDAGERDIYLTAIQPNARTLELAKEWLEEQSPPS
jgi:hypothetical protein